MVKVNRYSFELEGVGVFSKFELTVGPKGPILYICTEGGRPFCFTSSQISKLGDILKLIEKLMSPKDYLPIGAEAENKTEVDVAIEALLGDRLVVSTHGLATATPMPGKELLNMVREMVKEEEENSNVPTG